MSEMSSGLRLIVFQNNMLMSSKVHYDYTQANTKVNNIHIMINIVGKTIPERSHNVGTDVSL